MIEHEYGRRIPAPIPPHIKGCEIQVIEKNGIEITGICGCVEGCPERQAAIDWGHKLAKEHGW